MHRLGIALVAGIVLALAPPLAHAQTNRTNSYTSRTNAYIGTAKTDFAKVTPASALIYDAIQNTSPSQSTYLKGLSAVFGPAVRKLIGGATAGGKGNAGSSQQVLTGLTTVLGQIFNGELGLVFLPITTVANAAGRTSPRVHVLLDAGLQPGVGADQVRSFLALLGLAGKATSTYQGFSITTVNLGPLLGQATGSGAASSAAKNSAISSTFYSAVAGNAMVLASDMASLKEALNTYSGASPSIATMPTFGPTVSTLPSGRFLTFYSHIDTKTFGPLLRALGISSTSVSLPKKEGTLSAAYSVSAEKDGILIHTSPQYGTGSLAITTSLPPTPNAAAGFIPVTALLYGSISDPATLLRTLITAQATTGASLGKSSPGTIGGINITNDVLSWMHGELTIALLPVGAKEYRRDPSNAVLSAVSLVAMVKVQNQALVEAKLRKIIAAGNVASAPSSQVHLITVPGPGGQPLHIETSTPNGVGYTFYKGYLVLATALPADVASLQSAGSGPTITTSAHYKAALAHFAHGSYSAVFFANLTSLRKILEQYALTTPSAQKQYATVKDLLVPFKSVAMVSNAGTNGGGSVFIGIGK